MNRRIVIAGGSGFIGSALAREFVARGDKVIVLTRSPRKRNDGVSEIPWDGATAGSWAPRLDGAHAIFNLTGKDINCRHTPENLREIAASRVNSVNAIAAAMGQVQAPPLLWVQASAVGFYGDTGNVPRDESSGAGNDTLAEVCRQWEAAFDAAILPHTRKVTLRIGFVLGRNGGALPVLRKLTRLFLGGAAGGGRQYISWIHLADLVAIFVATVEDKSLTGIFNAVAPKAVTNAEFMRELRHVLDRPWCPPAPTFAVKLAARMMGSEPSLALTSQRCVPKRFAAWGFPFRYIEVRPALQDLCGK